MNKKLYVLIIIMLLCTVFICSCSDTVSESSPVDEETQQYNEQNKRFITICYQKGLFVGSVVVIVDTETKVQYVQTYHGSFTPLIDENGCPLLYEE